MYRRISIPLLASVFAVLLAIVALTELTDFRKGNRTFKKDLVEVDAATVTAIEIYPKAAEGKKILLSKQNDVWQVESEGKKYLADPSLAESLISDLNQMKPESVASSEKERWEQYQVTDSLGTRVKLLNGTNLLTDLYVGKFSYSQSGKMTSYVRMAEDNNVFGVDGMLGISFNRNLNSFRNKRVIQSSSADWRKLAFNYPADSSFTLEKANDKWIIGDKTADSASVAKYFETISNLTESSFTAGKPGTEPTHRLKIEGNNSMEPVGITGYYFSPDSVVMESSQNQGNYFNSADLAKKVFVPSSSFFK